MWRAIMGQIEGAQAHMMMIPGSARAHDMSSIEAHVLSENASISKKSVTRMKEAMHPLNGASTLDSTCILM